jgi:tetratricopeptide (TPR) repeat protein
MSDDAYDALVQRAQLLFQIGRFADCIDFAKRAIAANPNGADAYSALALAYTRVKGRNRDALQAIEMALGRAPDRVDIMANRAYVLDCLGKKRRAVKAATEALASDPNYVFALVVRSQVYQQLGRAKEAEADILRALALDPDDPSALGLYAQVLRQQDRFKESEAIVATLLSRAPRDCFGLTNAGWLAMERGNLKLAAEFVRSALSIDPNNEFARRTWFEVLRRRYFLYRWEGRWKEGALNILARDWTKSKWIYAVIIPHAGVILACVGGLTMMSVLVIWVLVRCAADYLIAIERTTRASLARREWYLTLAKGLLIVPVLIYLMLTQQWLITALCFVGVVTLFVGFFKLLALLWRKVVPQSQSEE